MPSKVMGISPELKTLHKIFPVVDFTIYKEYNGFMRFESTGTYSHKFTVICFDLIQTKSSAPITFISEDESLYTVKSVQVTKDGDIYKHQIEVTYDGEKLEQKSYKETSTITVRQEGNDKYEGETITFQVKITQNILFWAKVLPYDYSKGTVSCEIGEKLPPGYIIDSDTSGSLFTFTPKKGYCVADVKINGESQGAITSYRVTNDKNYLIEVFFEPSSVAKSVKVTLSVENEGGVITPKGEQFIDYGGSIKFNVTLKDGYAFKKYRIKNSESDKTHSIPAGYLNYESTISNICSNTTIQFWFNKWHKLYWDYNEGEGAIKVNFKNGNKQKNGEYIEVTEDSEYLIYIMPSEGYKIKSVKLGDVDITKKVENDVYKLPSTPIMSDTKFSVTFEKETIAKYIVKVFYDEGGVVKVNNRLIADGSSTSVTASTDVRLSIVPNQGYHLKSVTIGRIDKTSEVISNQLTISSISKNQEISILFEKDAPVSYTVKVSYNEGGTVKVNNNKVDNGTSTTVTASTNVQLSIVPNSGYHLKSVTVGGVDKTSEVSNNQLTITSISKNQEISILFEKDAPVSYTVKVSYNEGGTVKVNNNKVDNGTSTTVTASTNVQLSIVPNSGYHLKSVTVGGVDKTSEVRNNQLTITSISKNQEISILFEKDASINYTVKVSYNEGGKIKVNNNFVDNGTITTVTVPADVQLSVVPDKGYHLKQIMVGSVDKTNEVKENQLFFYSISENLEVSVAFEKDVPTSYFLTIFYKDRAGTVKVNGVEASHGQGIPISASSTEFIFLPAEGYRLKKAILYYQVMEVSYQDITEQIKNNRYTLLSSTSDLRLDVEFEQIPFFSFQIEGGAGLIKIDNEIVLSNYYSYMENIEYIAENAFSDCNSLYYLYIPVSKTPEVFNNSFSDLNYQLTKLAVPADYLPFYKNHPVWGKFSVIEPIGQASTYPVEIFLSEGGSMKFRVNKDEYWQDFNSSYYGTFDSASRIEFFVSPSEGYSIESVYLNGENITESLNDNNGFVIPYLLENTSISVKFKKKDVTSIDSVNADRYIYSIGSNQLILQGFKVGSLIHVYETSGRLIFRSEVQNNEEKIELPNKGIYFIRIGSENIKIAL